MSRRVSDGLRDTSGWSDIEQGARPQLALSGRAPAAVESLRLERADVLSLPAFWALGDVELHGLALLQALEAACLDRREVHKYIFASLPADKAVAFGIVKPLYCSLFCHFGSGVPFNRFTLEGIRK